MSDPSQVDPEPTISRVLQTKEETKSFYNKIASCYDLLAEHSEQPMRELGLQKLAASHGERILEIGFGTGHCVVELARAVGPSGHVDGIDLSERMLELATELVEQAGVSGWTELICGDGERLPYDDSTLDGVFTSFTLELFDTPDIPVVLAECKRVLKPGGRMVVVAVSKEGRQGVVMEIYEWTHRHFPNLLDCRPIYVRRALEAAGFAIRDTSLEMMWVPVEVVLAVK